MAFIISISFIFLSFCLTANYMIRNYPLQGVYFNELFSFKSLEYLRKSYEMDYWGGVYRKSLEYILEVDVSPLINISVANNPVIFNIAILPDKDRESINIVPIDRASYFITNYRWHPQNYIEYYKYHSLKVENNTVSEIFKLK